MDQPDTHPDTRAFHAVAGPVRALAAEHGTAYTIPLPRDWRRRAIPSRAAKAREVTISACPGGFWLDVHGRAGVLFSEDEWAQLCLEAILLLLGPAPE